MTNILEINDLELLSSTVNDQESEEDELEEEERRAWGAIHPQFMGGEYLPAVSLGRKAVDIARDHAPHLGGGLLAYVADAYVGLADGGIFDRGSLKASCEQTRLAACTGRFYNRNESVKGSVYVDMTSP